MLAVTAGEWIVSATTILSVLIGVFATGWWERRTFRWDQVERAAQRLVITLPHVSAPMWDGWQGERKTGVDSEWARLQGEVTSLLAEIMVGARRLRFGSGRASRVEAAANDLTAQLVAALLDFQQPPHRLLTTNRLVAINTASLFKAVFGERRSLDLEIAKHRREVERGQPPTAQAP